MLLWIYFFGEINDEFNGPYCLFSLGIQEVLSVQTILPWHMHQKDVHTGCYTYDANFFLNK